MGIIAPAFGLRGKQGGDDREGEIMRGSAGRIRFAVFSLVCLLVLPVASKNSSNPNDPGDPGESDTNQGGRTGTVSDLKAIQLQADNGQILSYRYNRGPTEVWMRGTGLSPQSRINLKVESRPGFLEIDINRGDINKLEKASRHGRDFLTYVLWAVSVAGKASNLGEITFSGRKPISINVTTPYQTFWLMVTAEPNYAVADPSPQVVLYSVDPTTIGKKLRKSAIAVPGELFYYTHYVDYDNSPGRSGKEPNALLQARKAVELAGRSGVLAIQRPADAPITLDEGRTRKAFAQAKRSLAQAERAYKDAPKNTAVVQFARTASQIAENARSLAVGAVGDTFIRTLERQVAGLQNELAKARARRPGVQRVADIDDGDDESEPVEEVQFPEIIAVEPEPTAVPAPVVWMGFLGWGLALLLLLRRQPS